MEEKQFETVINSLDNLINSCNGICVHSSEELDNLTVKELKIRLGNARSIHGKMDRVLSTDLYHIIGMGELTEDQMKLFIHKIKILCMFRPYIKPLAASGININEIPEKTSYKCSVLNVELKNEQLG